MVGVHMVGLLPTEGLDGGGAGAGGFSAAEGVLAIRFVSDADEFRAKSGGEDAGLELGFALMGETVAHAEREFAERPVFIHVR